MSLPPGWVQRESKSRGGRIYYYCEATKESTWERPVAAANTQAGNTRQQVRVLHILKKHRGSRRPASWRQENITQSLEEAVEQISGIRQKLLETLNTRGQDAMLEEFMNIASEESDCGSHERGGDLGNFGRGQMQKAFEEASFALEIGELSMPVVSDSGVHVILRVQLTSP